MNHLGEFRGSLQENKIFEKQLFILGNNIEASKMKSLMHAFKDRQSDYSAAATMLQPEEKQSKAKQNRNQ